MKNLKYPSALVGLNPGVPASVSSNLSSFMSNPQFLRLPIANLKFLGLLSVTLALAMLLGAPTPVHAGQWKLEKYIYSGNFRSDEYTIGSGIYISGHIKSNQLHDLKDQRAEGQVPDEAAVTRGDEVGEFTASKRWSVDHNSVHGPGYPMKSPKKGKALVDAKVCAVLVWKRGTLPNGDPDPNDNPPQSVWVWEQTHTTLVRSHGDNYTAENPYRGHNFATQGPMGQLGTEEAITVVSTGVQSNDPSGRPSIVTDSASSINLTRCDTGNKERLVLAACDLRGEAAILSDDWTNTRYISATVSFQYKAVPVHFQLQARRKDSGRPFGEARIAAGKKDNSDHMAEIEVRVTNNGRSQEPIPNVPISKMPKLEFFANTDEGHTVHADFLPPVQNGVVYYDPEAVTDGDGRALIGVMKSGDRILKNDLYDDGHITRVILGAKNGNYQGEAKVRQLWDRRNLWEYTPPLLLEGTMQPVKFKPVFQDWYDAEWNPNFVPIKNHTINMVVAKVQVAIWDPEHQQMEHKIVLRSEEYRDPNEELEQVFDAQTDLTALYAHFDGPAVEDVNERGTYTGILKSHASENVTIEKLWFKAQDDNVYEMMP